MQITLHLPDELAQHFNPDQLSREILEALVAQTYRAKKITKAEIRCILGLPSRWAVDDFLSKYDVELHYELADLEGDRATFQRLRS
ncbi:MAG: UPF0175 family protein [Coleofasciculaceae cyanobacterium RL_1_1]|nr:UPF0175 family protein [Coleofasciculaceae cyanobacterium RL_1_1]